MTTTRKSRLSTLLSHFTPLAIIRWFFPSPPSILASSVPGDVILGLQKRHEAFLFFRIETVDCFKRHLKSHVLREISSTLDVVRWDEEIKTHRQHHPGKPLESVRGLNLAFSAMGLAKLGVNVNSTFPSDLAFKEGQEVDALEHLGDPRKCGELTTWKEAYKGRHIDGCLIVTAPTLHILDHQVDKVLKQLNRSITLVKRKNGAARPAPHAGHEHFGFRDGVTRPTIVGFNDQHRPPGESASPASVFLLPSSNDKEKKWLENGTFMVFRELQQKVPEFEEWCRATAKSGPKEVSEGLIAARLVGRWKDVPLVLSPTQPQGYLENDVRLVNGFDFSNDLSQEACPYAAHIRKANPRCCAATGLPYPETHRILRSGIPYGREVTDIERAANKTLHERGLYFVCYQSSIERGFQHIQSKQLNASRFPPANSARILDVGQDLIAGQNPCEEKGPAVRTAQGIRPGDEQLCTNTVSAEPFVVPRGGEYFFMPSIPGLKYLVELKTPSTG
ncbi:hypothetical protein JCM8547_007913 [Rhodosporidiobolus lusitaniae]